MYSIWALDKLFNHGNWCFVIAINDYSSKTAKQPTEWEKNWQRWDEMPELFTVTSSANISK